MQYQTFSSRSVMCCLLRYCEKQSGAGWGVYFKSNFFSTLPSEQPKPLRKIPILKQPSGPLWVIASILLHNAAASFGVTCVVLRTKTPVPMKCYRCKTNIQQKLFQVWKHIPRKCFICSHPPLYWFCIIARHEVSCFLVPYSFSGLTVTNAHCLVA